MYQTTAMTEKVPMSGPPEGYHPLPGGESFATTMGELFWHAANREFRIGFWADERHFNHGNGVHGGVAFALADMAIGLALSYFEKLDAMPITVNASVDFLAPAPVGRWIEAAGRLDRCGRTLVFGSANVHAGETLAARVTSVMTRPAPSKATLPVFSLLRGSMDHAPAAAGCA